MGNTLIVDLDTTLRNMARTFAQQAAAEVAAVNNLRNNIDTTAGLSSPGKPKDPYQGEYLTRQLAMAEARAEYYRAMEAAALQGLWLKAAPPEGATYPESSCGVPNGPSVFAECVSQNRVVYVPLEPSPTPGIPRTIERTVGRNDFGAPGYKAYPNTMDGEL